MASNSNIVLVLCVCLICTFAAAQRQTGDMVQMKQEFQDDPNAALNGLIDYWRESRQNNGVDEVNIHFHSLKSSS